MLRRVTCLHVTYVCVCVCVQGYRVKGAYVATQGPLANTTHDFWRMVWQEQSCCIIMLTNLVEKSRVRQLAGGGWVLEWEWLLGSGSGYRGVGVAIGVWEWPGSGSGYRGVGVAIGEWEWLSVSGSGYYGMGGPIMEWREWKELGRF